jgi:glycine/D-amino acid oxidase-like deaminating enzyme
MDQRRTRLAAMGPVRARLDTLARTLGLSTMHNPDVIVIGAGVIGSSIAWHLAALGAGRVLVLERGQIGNGTSSQSSGILRTHYSVIENVELAAT